MNTIEGTFIVYESRCGSQRQYVEVVEDGVVLTDTKLAVRLHLSIKAWWNLLCHLREFTRFDHGSSTANLDVFRGDIQADVRVRLLTSGGTIYMDVRRMEGQGRVYTHKGIALNIIAARTMIDLSSEIAEGIFTRCTTALIEESLRQVERYTVEAIVNWLRKHYVISGAEFANAAESSAEAKERLFAAIYREVDRQMLTTQILETKSVTLPAFLFNRVYYEYRPLIERLFVEAADPSEELLREDMVEDRNPIFSDI